MKQVVSGVLLLDKPTGLSSHSALSQAKRLFMSPEHDSRKAGHTGTLDPMAMGLLPICLGEATKFSSFGLDADKGYHAVIALGAQTDSGDADGQIVRTLAVPKFSQADLDVIASSLHGAQQQVPPMYSALKKDGKKLYEYARAGVAVERTPRPISIHQLGLEKLTDTSIALNVLCSKGTYVRVLGETIAESLGTLGHLTALRRTQTGGFHVAAAISLDALAALDLQARLGHLLPVDALVSHLPILRVTADETARLMMGQRLNVKERLMSLPDCAALQTVRLYGENAFIGLGEVAANGRLQPKKLLGR